MTQAACSFDSYYLNLRQSFAAGCNQTPSVLQTHANIKQSARERKHPGKHAPVDSFEDERKSHRACARCRQLKQRCGSERPCRPCIRRGCADKCVDWIPGRHVYGEMSGGSDGDIGQEKLPADTLQVQRPIVWRQTAVRVVQTPKNCAEIGELSANRVFLHGALRNFNVGKGALLDLVAGIPDELCDALLEIFSVLSHGSAFIRNLVESGRQRTAGRPCSRLEGHSAVGFARCNFDCSSSAVGWDYELNDTFCRLSQAHPEELLVRAQQEDLVMPLSRVDMLCHILDSLELVSLPLKSPGLDEIRSTRFSVFTHGADGSGEPFLCRASTRVTFDPAGAVRCVERSLLPLSAEEYDLHFRLSPQQCRPFAAALGDTRAGAELLSGYRHDRSLSLTAWGKTTAGATTLSALTTQVRRCCQGHRAMLAFRSPPTPPMQLTPTLSCAVLREKEYGGGGEGDGWSSRGDVGVEASWQTENAADGKGEEGSERTTLEASCHLSSAGGAEMLDTNSEERPLEEEERGVADGLRWVLGEDGWGNDAVLGEQSHEWQESESEVCVWAERSEDAEEEESSLHALLQAC